MLQIAVFVLCMVGLVGCGGGGGGSHNDPQPVASSGVSSVKTSSVSSQTFSSVASSNLSSLVASSSSVKSHSSTVGTTFIQVNKATNFVYLYINNIERMRWAISGAKYFGYEEKTIERLGEKIDITPFLVKGNNKIKIISSSSNSIMGYDIKLWHNNELLVNESAQSDRGSENFPAINFVRELTLESTVGEQPAQVTINTDDSAQAIYINNVFSGKYAPAQFSLTPGDYRIGVGDSTSSVDIARNTVNMTGHFRQKDITVGSGAQVKINVLDLPVLTDKNQWRVALIPVTNVHFGLTNEQALSGVSATVSDIGVMTADDITIAQKAVEYTSKNWVEPMSYGLFGWNVTTLKPITQKMYLTDHLRTEDVPYDIDVNAFDMIVYVIADLTTQTDGNGNRFGVLHGIGGTGGRPWLTMPASWLNANGPTLAARIDNIVASSGMVHEFLHNFDGYGFFDYNGVDWLHGAEEHGYTDTSCNFPSGWVCWYTHYIRGQVAENTTVKSSVTLPDIISDGSADLFTGDFNIMRAGRGVEQLWSFSKPAAHVKLDISSDLCLDVKGDKFAEGSLLTLQSCQTATSNVWSVKRAINETAQIVNQETNMCVNQVGDLLVQKKCSIDFSQRFIVNMDSNGFQIKNMSGQCLRAKSNLDFGFVACDFSDDRQFWQYEFVN